MINTGTLQVSTPTGREIVTTRVFNEPSRLVFNTFTKAELVKQWLLGLRGWSMPVCEIDLKVGGAYRYLLRSADGTETEMRGVYREIVPRTYRPDRAVRQTVVPGRGVSHDRADRAGGSTTITTTVLYPPLEVCDAVIKSNMTRGVAASYDRPAELVETGASQA